MGNALSNDNLKNYKAKAISSLGAFHAPEKPTYMKSEGVTFVHTIKNDRIATYFVNHEGDNHVYWKDKKYEGDKKMILFSHGNADDIGACKAYCKWLAHTFDANVITYDYVNYGISEKGQTTEQNMQEAISAVYEYLHRELRVPQEKIVLMGKSLGTAPTVFLSAKDFMDDIHGVVLISPLASGVRAIMPKKLLEAGVLQSMTKSMTEYLDGVFCPSLNLVNFIRVPTFIIHGKQDDIIPIQNAEMLVARLHRKAYYPPLYVHAKHNDVESGNSIAFRDQMIAFFKSCVARKYERRDEETLVSY
jgi:abhydrolase domain-containing protein 17